MSDIRLHCSRQLLWGNLLIAPVFTLHLFISFMLQRFRSLGNRSVSLSKVSWHEKLGGNRYQQLCFLAYCASYDFMHLQLLKTFFKAGPTMLSFYYVLHSLIFGNLL